MDLQNLFAVSFGFERPWYLLLLIGIPVIWYFGFQSLAGLGRVRQITVLILRTVVLTLLIFSLAQLQWKLSTDRLTVIFLLDQSESIPDDKAQYMLDYAYQTVKKHRNKNRKDMAGVIIFGGDARAEITPYDGDLPLVGGTETSFDLRRDATNLESALKLAKALFPEATARRIVIVSDGNQNLGDAMSMAESMTEDGVGIDVVPVDLLIQTEVSVEKVVLPAEIRTAQDFEGRVVINYDVTNDDPTQTASGRLSIRQKTRDSDTVIDEIPVKLKPGKNVFGFKHQVNESTVFEFDATFIPDENQKTQDLIKQNNTASAFTHVRGRGRVLLIENGNDKGRFEFLVRKLQENKIEVDLMSTTDLFESPAELLQYDCVVLADVPRAGGDTLAQSVGFSDSQIKMLVSNMEEMGCGIVMIGGPSSFGAGGWANTELEKAMPVDFQIKNKRVDAVGALVLIMHASEMNDGNYWQSVIAVEAIKVLGPMDYCGVVEWGMGGKSRWLWQRPNGIDRVANNRKQMVAAVKRMVPGDMPYYDEPMRLALKGLTRKGFNPAMKHVIIISDGDATPPAPQTIQAYKNAGIKVSTVSVSSHGRVDQVRMQKIATATGGRFYPVTNPRALPRIFQREARRVAKPLIKENEEGIPVNYVQGAENNEILAGIDLKQLQPVRGYVMTTRKQNSLVQQLLVAADEKDEDNENSTILSTWRYGLGKATVFTTDAGHKWADQWAESDYYSKFFTQLIRYSMRPVRESANFTVSTEVKNDEVKVVVTALDDDEQLLDFLNIQARGIDPDMKGFDIQFDQDAPGRYVGKFKTDKSGNYLFSIFPGNEYERLTAGVTIPYSTEFTDREPNLPLLNELASLEPKGGEKGSLIEGDLTPASLPALLSIDPFRSTLSHTVGIQDIWPFLLFLTGLVFLADVFVRRVAINFNWVPVVFVEAGNRLRGRDRGDQVAQSMARLQSRKAQVGQQMAAKQAATRFEPDEAELDAGSTELQQVLDSEDRSFREKPRATKDSALAADQDEDQLHTARLLEAKRKLQRKRGEKPEPD